MAKSKAAGINALMQWMTGNVRGMNPDQMLNFLRQFPDVENMTVADLQRALAQIQPPASVPRPRSQSPVDVNERVAGNPATGLRPDGNIRAALQELDPEFYARIDSATPDEITEAYRNAVNRASRVRSGRPRKNATATPAGDPDGNAVRELLPGSQAADGPGAIPRTAAGDGVSSIVPPPLRPRARRGPKVVSDRAFRPPEDVGPAVDAPLPPPPGAEAVQPDAFTQRIKDGRLGGVQEFQDWMAARAFDDSNAPMARAAGDAADGPYPGMTRQEPPAAPLNSDFYRRVGAGAAALAAGFAAPFLLPRQGTTPPASGSPPTGTPPTGSTTADLVDETRPAPRVEATPDVPQPTVTQGTPDYSAQARQLIAQANEIQRREGRQTPESLALIRRADELYAQAAEGRRAGTQPPIMPAEQQNAQTSAIQRDARQTIEQNQGSSYRAQARRMMAELNMRSSLGSISQAEYSAMKSRIDELFRLADQEDNAPRNIPGRGRLPGAPTGGPQMLRPTGGYQRRPTPSTT